jgi:serine/threonine protein kinase
MENSQNKSEKNSNASVSDDDSSSYLLEDE